MQVQRPRVVLPVQTRRAALMALPLRKGMPPGQAKWIQQLPAHRMRLIDSGLLLPLVTANAKPTETKCLSLMLRRLRAFSLRVLPHLNSTPLAQQLHNHLLHPPTRCLRQPLHWQRVTAAAVRLVRVGASSGSRSPCLYSKLQSRRQAAPLLALQRQLQLSRWNRLAGVRLSRSQLKWRTYACQSWLLRRCCGSCCVACCCRSTRLLRSELSRQQRLLALPLLQAAAEAAPPGLRDCLHEH